MELLPGVAAGVQPSSRRALAFEAPRIRVIIECACPPAASRTSQPGMRRGGGAPNAAARPGTSSAAGAGALSTTLKIPGGVPLSMAATVAAAALSLDADDQDAGAVAADREAPLAEQLGVLAALGQRGAGPVEAAVAEHGAAGLGHDRLEVLDRVERLADVGGGIGVERRVLALDRVAHAGVGPARVALPHEPGHARLTGGGEQVIGALGAQPVGRGEHLVEVAAELERGQRRKLVHDDVGPRAQHCLAHCGGVERIEDDRLGAHRPDVLRAVAGGPEHVVTALDELGVRRLPRAPVAPARKIRRLFMPSKTRQVRWL